MNPVIRVLQIPESAVDRHVVSLQRLLEGVSVWRAQELAACDPSCTGSDRLERTGKCLFAALCLCGLCRSHKLVQAAPPVGAEGTGPGRFFPEARTGIFSEAQARQPHPFHLSRGTDQPTSLSWNPLSRKP